LRDEQQLLIIAELFGRAFNATMRMTWMTLSSTWSTLSSANLWHSHCRTFAVSSAKLLVCLNHCSLLHYIYY